MLTGLRAAEVQAARLEVDVVPLWIQDLSRAATCEGQWRMAAMALEGELPGLLGLGEDVPASSQLGRREVTLSRFLLVAADVTSGVRALRSPAPDFGEVEGLGEEYEHLVRHGRRLRHARDELGDFGSGDVLDLRLPSFGRMQLSQARWSRSALFGLFLILACSRKWRSPRSATVGA